MEREVKHLKELGFTLFAADSYWRKEETGQEAMPYSYLKMVVLAFVEDGKKS